MARFTIGVFALIFDQQRRVLLCHRRDHDLWNLPGGSLETGEAPWQGVVREVKEEVGLEVAVVDLAGVYSKPQQDEIVFSTPAPLHPCPPAQITLHVSRRH